MEEERETVSESNSISKATERGTEAPQYFKVCLMPSNVQRQLESSGMWSYTVWGLCEGYQVQGFCVRVSLSLPRVQEADSVLPGFLSERGGSIVGPKTSKVIDTTVYSCDTYIHISQSVKFPMPFFSGVHTCQYLLVRSSTPTSDWTKSQKALLESSLTFLVLLVLVETGSGCMHCLTVLHGPADARSTVYSIFVPFTMVLPEIFIASKVKCTTPILEPVCDHFRRWFKAHFAVNRCGNTAIHFQVAISD